MRALNVIDQAYRATLEEQDDTVVWLTHAMKGAGAELDVLLRGNAVNYAVRAQDASGLEFGAEAQTQPPRIPDDLAALLDKGVTVYLVSDDLDERGIGEEELIEGLTPVRRADLPRLFAEYAHVWHW